MGTKTYFHKSAGFGGVEFMNEDESVFRTLSRFMCVCVHGAPNVETPHWVFRHPLSFSSPA